MDDLKRDHGNILPDGDLRTASGERVSMEREHLREEMPPGLLGHVVRMFEQHCIVTLQTITDPVTGEVYANLSQVYDVLGLDVDEARARLLADPVPSDGVVIVAPDATRLPPVTPGDLQVPLTGLCGPNTCWF
jgi:hypothetical protein